MGWIAALFVGLLGWLLVHDIRTRETGLAALQAHREYRPGAYWAIIAFWSLCWLLSASMALGAYLYGTNCAGDPCVVTVHITPP